jgi:capsule polysaccharide export protein KpsC/LpsZ
LSQILPEDVNIVVKEHPNQRFWRGRNLAFYPNISKLRNVSLISKNTDSFKLIDKSIAVATITGQAGWEAITNSKPVIYFGQAWYKGVPGSVHINEFKVMSPEARKDFLNEKSFSELQAWYISFYKRSFPGFVNNIMTGSELPNISHIATCINKYLSNERVENIE